MTTSAFANMVKYSQSLACPDDYNKDGIAYCAKCHTPKQTTVTVDGVQYKPYCLCECKRAELDAEHEKYKQRLLQERKKIVFGENSELLNATFENDDGKDPKTTGRTKKYAEKWAEMLKENIGILLWGGVGNGKTYFSAAIAHKVLEQGYSVYMTSFPVLNKQLSGFTVDDKAAFIRHMCEKDLLVIDDLGTECDSDYSLELVYSVLDERYRAGKPLILTTNLSATEIKQSTDMRYRRIYDRITEMCVPMFVEGEGRRAEKRKEKINKMAEIFGA